MIRFDFLCFCGLRCGKIIGYSGTSAERYAKSYEIVFESVGSSESNSQHTSSDTTNQQSQNTGIIQQNTGLTNTNTTNANASTSTTDKNGNRNF